MKKKLLFVCIENSNRSQMSQAFAKILGGANVEAYSAGSKPSGIVNPKAIAAMKELGYDLSSHDSKSLKEVEQYAPFDAVITMGCGDACPWMPAKKFIDWQIPGLNTFRLFCTRPALFLLRYGYHIRAIFFYPPAILNQ